MKSPDYQVHRTPHAKMLLKDLFEVEGCPPLSELKKSFLQCFDCGAEHYIESVAEVNWSRSGYFSPDFNTVMGRVEGVTFDLQCGTDACYKKEGDDETSYTFCVGDSGVYIHKIREVFTPGKSITTSQVLFAEACDTELLIEAVSDFLLLPIGAL